MRKETVDNFSGGMTDDYLDQVPNTAEHLENVLLNRFGKPYQRDGMTVYNADAPRLPPGNLAVDDLYYFDSTLFAKVGQVLYYIEDGDSSWTTLHGVSSVYAFYGSASGAKCTWSEWRGHLFVTPEPVGTNGVDGLRTQKIFRNGSGTWTVRQAGVPRTEDATENGSISLTYSLTEAHNYTFCRCLVIEYTAKVDGVDTVFREYGKPETYFAKEIDDVANNYMRYGNLTYSNGTGDNYDTANMAVAKFRTLTDGDSTLYYDEDEALGANIDFDNGDDAITRELFYAQGDEQYNDPVPVCNFSSIFDGHGWFAGTYDIDADDFMNSRIMQSNPLMPYGVPTANYCTVEGKLTALNNLRGFPMAWVRNHTYRIEGRLDTFGSGQLRAVSIADQEGSVSSKVVHGENGIFFVSENGICYTDGTVVLNLTQHLKTTFGKAVNRDTICGAYDSKRKLVYFAFEHDDYTASVNNTMFVIDEQFTKKQANGNGVIALLSARNGSTDYMKITAMHYDSENDVMILGHKNGYVFKFDPDEYTDPVVDTSESYADWAKQAISWDITTRAYAFGTNVIDKWITKFYMRFRSLTGDLSVDLTSINDDASSGTDVKSFRDRSISGGIHKIMRRFPRTGLRAIYKQLRFRKGTVIIENSDDNDTCTISSTTATLDSGNWPTDGGEDMRGHSIYLAGDSYTTGYEITAQSGANLTLASAPGNVAASAWVIKGIPKGEDMQFDNLTFEYNVRENTDEGYEESQDGENS